MVAVSGLVTGAILFGLGDLTLLSGDTVSLANGLLRALAIVGYVSVGLLGLVAIGLFISTLTEVPIAAMAATVATTIVAEVLDQVPQLGSARSLLFTHNWLGYGDLLRAVCRRRQPREHVHAAAAVRADLRRPRLGAVHQQGHHQLT